MVHLYAQNKASLKSIGQSMYLSKVGATGDDCLHMNFFVTSMSILISEVS